MQKVAFYLEEINRKVVNVDVNHPDEIFMKGSLEACIQALAKKKGLTVTNVEPLSAHDSYRIFFSKKEGMFSRKVRQHIYLAKII